MKTATAHQLETLYQEHQEAIVSFLRKRSDDYTLVDDLVQDTFLKLYAFLKQGKTLVNPRGWLLRVARNMLIDHYRREGRDVGELKTEVVSNDEDHLHGPEDCLLGIIAGLPYKYKKAVYLVDVKGIRQVDAAQKLGISLPTFKSHVQRGRKLVKEGYVACCNYEVDENGHLQGEAKDWSECEVCSQN